MLLATAVAVASSWCYVAAALGALPKKGGVYVGTVKASPFEMAVNLGVTPDGKKRASPTCAERDGRRPSSSAYRSTPGALRVHEEDGLDRRLEDARPLHLTDEGVRVAELPRVRRLEGIGDVTLK